MIEYKPKTIIILKNIISVIFFILIIFTIQNDYNNLLAFILIIIVVYFFLFFKRRLISLKVLIEENNINLAFKSYLIFQRNEVYKIEDLKYSFDYQIGPRGIKRKEFRLCITNSDKLIISIVPNFDGWSEKVLDEILIQLNKLESKK